MRIRVYTRRTNIKSNISSEIEYTLKPSTYDAKPCDFALYRTKVQMSTPFKRETQNFAPVFDVPLPSLSNVSFFFSRWKCGIS